MNKTERSSSLQAPLNLGLIVSLLSLYFLLTLPRLIDYPPPWVDDAYFMAPGHSLLTRGVWGSDPMAGAASRWLDSAPDRMTFFQPPLYLLLVTDSFKAFGFGLLQARLVSVVLGALTVTSTYVLTLKITKNRVASFVAALFLLTQPLFILISRQTRPESAVIFLTILGMYVFLKYWEKPGPVLALLIGVLLGLAAMSHYNGFFGVITFLALFLIARLPVGVLDVKGAGLFGLGVLIACLPYILYVIIQDFSSGFYYFRTQIAVIGRVGSFTTIGDYLDAETERYHAFFHDFRFVPGGSLFFQVVYFIILASSFLWRNRVVKSLLLVIGIYLLLLAWPSPNKTNLYLGVVLPFFSVLLGILLVELHQRFRRYLQEYVAGFWVLSTVLVLAFTGINARVWYSYFDKYRDCDFARVMSKVRDILPGPGVSVMGRYTFWIGLPDYTYYRWGFRDFEDIKAVQPDIFIHNDFRMTRPELAEFKAALDAYFREHAEFIGEVPGHPREYCRVGHLRIYSVQWEGAIIIEH